MAVVGTRGAVSDSFGHVDILVNNAGIYAIASSLNISDIQ
jgi:NADP-dependent 3-hydroxy acid dehydrogenase YdfG